MSRLVSVNPVINEFMKIIDKDNGEGYSSNITGKGNLIKLPTGNTKMLYEVKVVDNVKIVFIKYIHYDSTDELLNLMAFACQWWVQLKPHIIYYKEKERQYPAGEFLVNSLGFDKQRIKNNLKSFHCLNDSGDPCVCKLFEYITYGNKRKKSRAPKKQKKLPVIS